MIDPVHVGRDGWLFLTGGSNNVLKLYRATPRSWLRYRAWRRLIESRATRCEALGAAFLQVVVPEKLTAMPERCDRPLVDVARSPGRTLGKHVSTSRCAANFLDLSDALASASVREDVYFRTDTHWNFRGVAVGYQAICGALGASPEADILERPFHASEQFLDLGSKLTPPLAEVFKLHTTTQRARQTWVNELIALHREGRSQRPPRVGSQAIFENDAADCDHRKVMLFGDSCAHYDPFALTGMLAETFRELHFVWSARIDWGLVESVHPDIVICEIAERFLRRVPVDDATNLRSRSRPN